VERAETTKNHQKPAKTSETSQNHQKPVETTHFICETSPNFAQKLNIFKVINVTIYIQHNLIIHRAKFNFWDQIGLNFVLECFY